MNNLSKTEWQDIAKQKVFKSYNEHFSNQTILEEYLDENSAYFYLYLDGVAIASMFGGEVEFMIYDEERDCEKIFYTIEDYKLFVCRIGSVRQF